MFEFNTFGIIMLVHGTNPPEGWLLCDGRELKIRDNRNNEILCSLLGDRFGGNTYAAFLLPNLPAVGEFHYAICVNGVYPSRPN